MNSSSRLGAPIAALLTAVLLLPRAASAQDAEGTLDLEGAWYVLIHYRDEATANPDVDRWDDRMWTFAEEGSRLRWTESPIVVFKDQTGRFGRVGRNPRSRILHAWEPNELQQAEIQEGLQTNKRGTKTKTLRGSAKRGYKSTGGSRTVSAMTVGYQETWSIGTPSTLPVFTRDDVMGTQASMAAGSGKNFSGRTQYTTLEVSADGTTLEGSFVRDENRKGTFRMVRSGAPRALESDGRTPNEKQGDRLREAIQAGVEDEAYRQFLVSLEEAGIGDIRERIGVDALDAIWRKYSAKVIAGDQRAVAQLTEEIQKAYAKAVVDDFAESFVAGDIDSDAALEQAVAAGNISQSDLELARNVREALGEERVRELRARYGDRVRAGDEKATRELREEVEIAVADAMKQQMSDRIRAGDAEAVREWREQQRNERDRQP